MIPDKQANSAVQDKMKYPGRVIKTGEHDPKIVKALKLRLNEALAIEQDPALRLDPNDPDFGPKMKKCVKLFQASNVDTAGRPLKQDGEVTVMQTKRACGINRKP